jgi:hypothetical protein
MPTYSSVDCGKVITLLAGASPELDHGTLAYRGLCSETLQYFVTLVGPQRLSCQVARKDRAARKSYRYTRSRGSLSPSGQLSPLCPPRYFVFLVPLTPKSAPLFARRQGWHSDMMRSAGTSLRSGFLYL